MTTAPPVAAPARVTFPQVFAVREFTALWAAQLVSIAGDQVARVALAVLVYDRTRSAGLAAVVFAVNTAAMFAGSLLLSWTADRWPRRTVMITCDVACLVLVAVMAVPGLPPGVLVAVLFVVTLALAPFLSARMALNREVLGPARFPVGNGITLATYQVGQLAGFAAGGLVVAAAGYRTGLLIDAATFAVSAVIIRAGVKTRPAPGGPARPERPEYWAGARAVLASPAAVTAMGLMWLAAFYNAPEGVVTPLAASYGGGAGTVGWLLAALTAGATVALLLFPRFGRPQWAAVSAAGACAVLWGFALAPPLAGALVLLFASGLGTGYLATAGGVLFEHVPAHQRGQASGLVGAGMSLGQAALIMAAGAAAGWFTPADVIADAGLAGTACAAVLAVRWRRVATPGTGMLP